VSASAAARYLYLTWSAAASTHLPQQKRSSFDHDVTVRIVAFRSTKRGASLAYPMGPMIKRAIVGVLLSSTLGMWSAGPVDNAVPAQPRPGIVVTRIFTGSDGQTHAEEIRMKVAPTDVSTEVSEMVKAPGVQFRRQAPKYFEDWHTAPRRQYVITLSGRGEIELSDGERIALFPGRILLVEDLTGKGHISRGVGPDARISILIPLTE
jgi:hypothetical protein